MLTRNEDKRRIARDGAASDGRSFTAGDVAVAQSLDMSATTLQSPERDRPEPYKRQPIGREEILEANQLLMRYKQGKANLETRIVENQQWYKLRQWECLRRQNKGEADIEPVSAWLLNSIANKHADAMDNFPAANVLPREEGDKQEAKILSSILPVVMDQCEFEQTYSDTMNDKIINGTGCYGVFWDAGKHNGLGDIDITNVDLISLFWEPGIMDIQQSRNVFYVTLQDNDILEGDYPELKDKLSNPAIDLTKYVYDDTVDTNDKSAVVDWYYKKRGQDGKTVLHYCKFIAGVEDPLFATENDAQYAQDGWYAHGLYPFVFDVMYPCKGTPTGFGYIDVAKSAQEFIDRGDRAILQNLLFNARPRHMIRNGSGVNEEEFANAESDFIHVEGSLTDETVRPVQTNQLSGIYVEILANKVQELKETTGNRDVTTGGTTAGITAASAIAALQEAGNRLSRDMNKGSYRAFRKVVLLCIELIRQFYDVPRQFRIVGEGGMQQFVTFSNAGLQPQPQGPMVGGVPMEMGVEVGYRLPLFDLEISAEKQSPYSKMAQNELALQFYSAGFFAPENADAALACLDMMDFTRKEFIVQKIQQNQTLLKMLQETQQMCMQLAAQVDPGLAQVLMQKFGMAAQSMPGSPAPGANVAQNMPALGGSNTGGESRITAAARARAGDTTAPR